MIKIGVGNTRGGVGSTTLCLQVAALIQRLGISVAIAETDIGGSALHWCKERAAGERRLLNAGLKGVGYFYVDDFSDLRLADQHHSHQFLLLDYCNSRDDIEQAVRQVDYWVCPFGPLEHASAIATYGIWERLRKRGSIAAGTFVGVINKVPSASDIEGDEGYACDRYRGEYAIEEIRAQKPNMTVLTQRIRNSAALADNFAGKDIYLQAGDDAEAARQDINGFWNSLLQNGLMTSAKSFIPGVSDRMFSVHSFRQYTLNTARRVEGVDAPRPRVGTDRCCAC